MVEIRLIVHTENFEKDVRKIKDKLVKEKLEKQIKKIIENPDAGKPLRYNLRGEWAVRVKPYRLIYKINGDRIILLRFEHRKEVY
ncbi:MAG: type II toxin-antitoxin system RelE/ParE family toxin [Candidatus Aenigmarchaeota archaeon]|nr:type II toxin-antitoxin system RelE/ParE family toxin [Candidatus Aenigmarchaeota archaeon]